MQVGVHAREARIERLDGAAHVVAPDGKVAFGLVHIAKEWIDLLGGRAVHRRLVKPALLRAQRAHLLMQLG